jgi:hypothetical protein
VATTPLPFPQDSTGSVGPAAPLPAGTAVAHLTIERVLHEGLHNVVYLARDPGGQAVALMEYFPRALALRQPDGSVRARQAGDAIALSVGREAFVVDANTLERIEHPGLVRVLGSLQAYRTVYRAMVFVDGPTLERHVGARGSAASAGAVVRLLDALLDALDVLHHAGIVHGCVRPDQILLAAGDRPVLLGMGSAGAEITGHDAGPWDAPEQAAVSRHDRINSATDLYMAAATAWFYATGDAPPALRERLTHPDDWDAARALAELPEAGDDPPGTRERLAAALKAALALVPSERPQRVADLRRLLHPGAAPAPFEASGAAPLWVGTMPDRESQWEVVERVNAEGGEAPAQAAAPTPVAADVEVLPRRRHDPHATDASVDAPFANDLDAGTTPQRRTALLWILPLLVLAAGLAAAAGWWLLHEEPMPAFGTVASPVAGVGDTTPAVPAASAPPVPAAAPIASAVAPPQSAEPAPLAASAAVASPAPTPTPTQAETPSPVSAAPAPPLRTAKGTAAKKAAPVARSPARPVANRPVAQTASATVPCSDRRQLAYMYCLQAQCAKPVWRNHPQCSDLRRSADTQ